MEPTMRAKSIMHDVWEHDEDMLRDELLKLLEWNGYTGDGDILGYVQMMRWIYITKLEAIGRLLDVDDEKGIGFDDETVVDIYRYKSNAEAKRAAEVVWVYYNTTKEAKASAS